MPAGWHQCLERHLQSTPAGVCQFPQTAHHPTKHKITTRCPVSCCIRRSATLRFYRTQNLDCGDQGGMLRGGNNGKWPLKLSLAILPPSFELSWIGTVEDDTRALSTACDISQGVDVDQEPNEIAHWRSNCLDRKVASRSSGNQPRSAGRARF